MCLKIRIFFDDESAPEYKLKICGIQIMGGNKFRTKYFAYLFSKIASHVLIHLTKPERWNVGKMECWAASESQVLMFSFFPFFQLKNLKYHLMQFFYVLKLLISEITGNWELCVDVCCGTLVSMQMCCHRQGCNPQNPIAQRKCFDARR
nr:hypothetical protein [Bacteroidota bacterium]